MLLALALGPGILLQRFGRPAGMGPFTRRWPHPGRDRGDRPVEQSPRTGLGAAGFSAGKTVASAAPHARVMV
jgi:hypothetical protein